MRKQILVVDDDKIVRDIVSKWGELRGAAVVMAADGREAEGILSRQERYDLVVLDLLFPYLSGWDILEKLRNLSSMHDVPVVILTGTRISSNEKGKLLNKVRAVVDKAHFSLEGFGLVVDSCCNF